MKLDSIKRYLQLQESLKREKAALENRLAKINQALESTAGISPAALGGAGPRAKISRGQQLAWKTRRLNKMSLREAIIKATREKALTKPEILAAVQKLGYRFATKQPVGSVNAILYAGGQFKNVNGRFSPAK